MCSRLALPLLLLFACSGRIEDGRGGVAQTAQPTDPRAGATAPHPPTPSGGVPPVSAETACAGAGPHAGPSPIRRLTRHEYDATVAALLGERTTLAAAFTPEEKALGFDNNADALGVSPLLAEQYEAAAATLASRAVDALPALLGCDPVQSGDDACARAFVRGFGLRVYRRPLTAEEQDRYARFHGQARQEHGFKAATRMVVQAMLQSPHFLYRVEVGVPLAGNAAVRKLAPYELASRLSYLFWNSMPDQTLFDAAAANDLATPVAVARHARRLLADPRARPALMHFASQWLDVDLVKDIEKDLALFPAFKPSLRALFERETQAFLDAVLVSGDGKLATLLRADYTYANRDLAAFYGAAGATTDAFTRVNLDRTRRSGILTQAAFLSSHADAQQGSPVARGLFVRERLLCAPPPPAPTDVKIEPPPFDKTLTTRERFARHRQDPACASCHRLFDPVGMSLEHFDALGQWRDREAGRAIDATGELFATDDIDGTYSGAVELSERLARSDQVRRCLVKQAFRAGYGRAEQEADRCTLARLEQATSAGGDDLRALFVGLTQTDPFLYRSAGAGL